MPNWKLTADCRKQIHDRAADLLSRRVDLTRMNFPLTHDQVQRAIISERQLAMMTELANDGVNTLPTSKEVQFQVLDNRLRRPVALRVWLKHAAYIMSRRGYRSGSIHKFRSDSCSYPMLEVAQLPPAVQDDLMRWINAVVREIRVERLVVRTIDQMLDHHLPTVGHVQVRWPALAALASGDAHWRPRFAEKMTRPGLYEYHSGTGEREQVERKYGAGKRAADIALLGAEMLPTCEPHKQEVWAFIDAYQSLPEDFEYNWT